MGGVNQVERLTVTLTGGTGSTNLTSSPDLSKCCLFFTRRATSSTPDDSNWGYHSVRGRLLDTPKRVVMETGVSGEDFTIEATVVEFDSGVNVYDYDFTIPEGQDSLNVTLSPTVTKANTLMNFSYKQATYPMGNNSLVAVQGKVTSGSQLTFTRNQETLTVTDMVFSATSGSTTTISSALLGLPDMEVGDRFRVTDHSTGGNNEDYTVTTVTTSEGEYICTSDGTPADAPSEQADAMIMAPQVDGTAYVAESIGGLDFTVAHEDYTFPNNDTIDNHAVTSVTEDKTFMLVSWGCENTANNDNNRMCPYFFLQSATNIRGKRSTGDGDIYVSAQLVSFSGDETVQRGLISDYSDIDLTDLAFSGSSGSNTTISSALGELPDLVATDTFDVDSYPAVVGNEGEYTITSVVTPNTTWSCTKTTGTPTDNAASSATILTDRQTVHNVTITSTDELSMMPWIPGPQSFRHGFARGSHQSDIASTYYAAKRVSDTEIEIERRDAGFERNTEAAWEVIEWGTTVLPPPARRIIVV